VLEIGCGSGLSGIVAAIVKRSCKKIFFTDYDKNILQNCLHNAGNNLVALAASGYELESKFSVRLLDLSNFEQCLHPSAAQPTLFCFSDKDLLDLNLVSVILLADGPY
jgi:predicted nicotinamide N-methyase